MADPIERWPGGRLRLYWQLPAPMVGPRGERVVRQPFVTGDDQPKVVEREYRPLGEGWAIRADLPLDITLGEDQPEEIRGLHVRLDMRDGSLQCVAVHSPEGGPALTHTVLRKLGKVVSLLAERYWPDVVARLIVLEDGTIAAEWSQASPTPERPTAFFGEPGQDVLDEYHRRARRPGRRPLSDELLAEVAAVYREAERIGRPRIERLRERFPGYSDATLRNWVRKSRKRGFLGPAPSPHMAGERRMEREREEHDG